MAPVGRTLVAPAVQWQNDRVPAVQLEPGTGFEPVYAALQAAASPLGQPGKYSRAIVTQEVVAPCFAAEGSQLFGISGRARGARTDERIVNEQNHGISHR